MVLAVTLASCAENVDHWPDDRAQAQVRLWQALETGPDPFTPSVATGDARICDKAAFGRHLEARPAAKREFARILSVDETKAEAYVGTLRPATLPADTTVLHHTLPESGQALQETAVLGSGTPVLVDDRAGSVPVARCASGSPLGAAADSPLPAIPSPPTSATDTSPPATSPRRPAPTTRRPTTAPPTTAEQPSPTSKIEGGV